MSDFDNKTNSLYNYIKEIEARERSQRRIKWYSLGVSLFTSAIIFSFVWYQKPFQQANAASDSNLRSQNSYVRFTLKTFKTSLARDVINKQGKYIIIEYPYGISTDTLRNLQDLNKFATTYSMALPDKVRQDESPSYIQDSQQVDTDQRPFILADQMPEFPGGKNALAKYLQSRLKYPAEAKSKQIEGSVQVRFVVEADGSVSRAEIVKGIGYGCDEEALRLISQMPDWIPGENEGVRVPVYKALAIQFQLL